MLNTNFLWYLLQIRKYRSLSVAAEHLHITQPALSSAVKNLEEQLGVKLLERSYKGVFLTEEGKEIAEKAEKVFALLDDIEYMYKKTNEEDLLDNIMLYVHPALSSLLLSSLTKNSAKGFLNKDLQVRLITPDTKQHDILSATNNIVILTILPTTFQPPPNIELTVLSKSKAYFMCANDFPYIDSGKTSISIKELSTLPLVIVDNSFAFLDTILDLIKKYGPPNIKITAPDYNSIVAITANGLAGNFSYKFGDKIKNPNLRHLPIRNAPIFQLCLLANKNINPTIIAYLSSLILENIDDV